MKKALTTLGAVAAIAVLAVTGSIVGDGGHAQAAVARHRCTHRHPCVNPGGPNIPGSLPHSIVGDAAPRSIVGD